MNTRHLQLCASAEWAETVRQEILPWALSGRALGDDVLEVGPGPGTTTDVLRYTVARLTAVEVDGSLAAALAARLLGSNVEVVHADGAALPFEAGRFSGATSPGSVGNNPIIDPLTHSTRVHVFLSHCY